MQPSDYNATKLVHSLNACGLDSVQAHFVERAVWKKLSSYQEFSRESIICNVLEELKDSRAAEFYASQHPIVNITYADVTVYDPSGSIVKRGKYAVYDQDWDALYRYVANKDQICSMRTSKGELVWRLPKDFIKVLVVYDLDKPADVFWVHKDNWTDEHRRICFYKRYSKFEEIFFKWEDNYDHLERTEINFPEYYDPDGNKVFIVSPAWSDWWRTTDDICLPRTMFKEV